MCPPLQLSQKWQKVEEIKGLIVKFQFNLSDSIIPGSQKDKSKKKTKGKTKSGRWK